MEACTESAAPAAEETPVAVAPTEPPPLEPPPLEQRRAVVLHFITQWRIAREIAADARVDADVAAAQALVASDGKNDAVRKAHATIASADLERKAEILQAQAQAAGAVVDMLLGGRAR